MIYRQITRLFRVISHRTLQVISNPPFYKAHLKKQKIERVWQGKLNNKCKCKPPHSPGDCRGGQVEVPHQETAVIRKHHIQTKVMEVWGKFALVWSFQDKPPPHTHTSCSHPCSGLEPKQKLICFNCEDQNKRWAWISGVRAAERDAHRLFWSRSTRLACFCSSSVGSSGREESAGETRQVRVGRWVRPLLTAGYSNNLLSKSKHTANNCKANNKQPLTKQTRLG